MTPVLQGIDHVHVYVADRAAAARWYQRVLGMQPVAELEIWATKQGPLTLENSEHNVHLALFESDRAPGSTIAFRVCGESFLAWREHLQSHGLALRIADHDLAWSLYFTDPWGNQHEITSYDYDYISQRRAADPD